MTDPFDFLSPIGKGGMATVWKALDRETGRTVAIKLLHEVYVDDPEYVERFQREVDIVKRIVSPYVVQVFGYGQRDGVPFVVMEYIDGEPLSDLLRRKGPLRWRDWGQAKSILLHTARGLEAAHAAGVIHRDIKPSNILVDRLGNARLADFGIARATDMTRMTASVGIIGTPAYMAPDPEATEQSDLYALGCVLYEVLTGHPPFQGSSHQEVLMRHLRDAPDLSKLPEEARASVGSLLEKDPKRRPPSARALANQLATKTEVPADSSPKRGWPGLRRVAVGSSGVALSVIASVSALAATGNTDRIPFLASATPEPVSTRIFPTPTPTIAAATDPATPEITGLLVKPEAATAGETVNVSVRIHDANGDATQVEMKTVAGYATWFDGRTQPEPVTASARQQLLGTAVFTVGFKCKDFSYKTSVEFTVVDATGAKSLPSVATFSCQGTDAAP